MKHSLLFSVGIFYLIALSSLAGCDDIDPQSETEIIELDSLFISPDRVTFDEISTIGDLITMFRITLATAEPVLDNFRYSVERSGQVINEGDFEPESERTYTAAFELSLNTAESVQFTVHAYSADNIAGDRLRGRIQVIGRTVSPPVIEDAFNTEEVTIPDTGNRRIDFFAKVIHPDNQEFIESVNFFLIDQEGNRLGDDDFEMFDDGALNEPEGFIDETAADSLYSRALFIDSTNNPDDVSVFYYALGIDAQSSDTLQTELRIVE